MKAPPKVAMRGDGSEAMLPPGGRACQGSTSNQSCSALQPACEVELRKGLGQVEVSAVHETRLEIGLMAAKQLSLSLSGTV
jgi:hypothetical protein